MRFDGRQLDADDVELLAMIGAGVVKGVWGKEVLTFSISAERSFRLWALMM